MAKCSSIVEQIEEKSKVAPPPQQDHINIWGGNYERTVAGFSTTIMRHSRLMESTTGSVEVRLISKLEFLEIMVSILIFLL